MIKAPAAFQRRGIAMHQGYGSPLRASLGLALALFAAAASAQPQQPTKLRFSLDWRYEGQFAAFMMAKTKGYYEKEGLDVAVDSGQGSGASINRVAGGSHDLATADLTSVIEALGNNPGGPTRFQAVYLVYSQTPFVVQTIKKTGITRPQELAGKRISAPVFDSVRKSFPLYARAIGIDPKSVTFVNVDPALRETLVVRGDAEATTGFELNRLTLIARGVKDEDIVVFRYADAGVKLFSNVILASSKLIAENPKALEAFLRATNAALKDTIANPEEAIKANKTFDPIIEEAVELQKLKIMLRSINTAYAHDNGLGALRKLDLESQVDDVAAAFALKTKPNADLIFNSSFLPPKSERIPPKPAEK
jgi:NitT/TauT family transport system substrate-binding protein